MGWLALKDLRILLRSLPSWKELCPGEISLTTATRGLVGPLPRVSPTTTPRPSG